MSAAIHHHHQTRYQISLGHSYRLIPDGTGSGIKFIADVGNARVIQIGDISLKLIK